jgi:gallate decarboxylase subunit D
MKPALHRVTLQTPESDYGIEHEGVRIGADILVYIWGGECPHTGAVAAAQPRPSLSDPNETSATASVLTYPAHKEDSAVKLVAEALAARLSTNAVVTAGIHWDNLPAQSIDVVMDRCREITDLLGRALEQEEK